MIPAQRRKRLRIALALLPLACFAFWFVTAPAGFAVQRAAAGTGRGPLAVAIINAAEWYEAPMAYFDKIPVLKRVSDSLDDLWCRILDPPETTP